MVVDRKLSICGLKRFFPEKSFLGTIMAVLFAGSIFGVWGGLRSVQAKVGEKDKKRIENKEGNGERRKTSEEVWIPLEEKPNFRGWRILFQIKLNRYFGKKIKIYGAYPGKKWFLIQNRERVPGRDEKKSGIVLAVWGESSFKGFKTGGAIIDCDQLSVMQKAAKWGIEAKMVYWCKKGENGRTDYYLGMVGRDTSFSWSKNSGVLLSLEPIASEYDVYGKPAARVEIKVRILGGFSPSSVLLEPPRERGYHLISLMSGAHITGEKEYNLVWELRGTRGSE